MVSVSNEDLNEIKKKKQRLIFIIGPHGSGKASQSQKIVNEFKYAYIKMSDLIIKEIKASTQLGTAASEYVTKSELLPSALAVAILVKGIISFKESTVLIEGFPRSLDQAIYYEQNVTQIKLILNFNAIEDTCLRRLSTQYKKQGKEINIDSIKQKNERNAAERLLVIDFFSKYGIIRSIDAEKPIGTVNELVKQSLYPLIYSIIGKRYSGKTELSKVLKRKMGIALIDFETFIQRPEISKRLKETDYVVGAFIASLRKMEDFRVLIENFPQTKEQFSYFVNNCKAFERIFYLNANNSTCLERLNELDIDDPNYTDCSELTKMLNEFESKKDYIDFLKKKPNFCEINVNNHKPITISNFISIIQPYCIIIKAEDTLKESKKSLIDTLVNDYKFRLIDFEVEIQNSKIRNIPIANANDLNAKAKAQLIRPILANETNMKFILENFPSTINDLDEFETSLCHISKMLYISDAEKLESINNGDIEVYLKNRNKLMFLNSTNITPYQIEECLDMTRDINICYGLPMSGKSTIAKHLQQKYNFKMLDFKDLIEAIKKTKIDPENPDAEPELVFQDVIKGLQDYLRNEPLSKRVIIDNFFIPIASEAFLIDTYEKANQIIKTIGKFRTFFEATCDENTLLNRYKLKEGIGEELTEEQSIAFNETQEKPKLLIETLHSISNQTISVDTNGSEGKSKLLFDYLFGNNFIVIKHEYDIDIDKKLEVFCTKNKLMFINVPKLIFNHFDLNDNFAKKLEGSYGRKILKSECFDETKWNEYVYYKYNPVHFDIGLVNEMILHYANVNYREIEHSGNYIVLTGYLNYDLLKEDDAMFNLPLLELKQTMDLGDLTAFIQITRNDIKEIEDEDAVELIIDKPKKVIKRDPLDVDGVEGEENPEQQQEEQPPEEENPDEPPKFKPEGMKWTNYDGVPRNYVQVLKRLKRFPTKLVNANQESASKELIRMLDEHLDNYKKRNETHYSGEIGIIKI